MEEEKKRKEADWSLDELSLLSKGLVKYPVGTKNRWATIASFLGTKNSDEVLLLSKVSLKIGVTKSKGIKPSSSYEGYF